MIQRLEALSRRRSFWVVLLLLALACRLAFVLTAPDRFLWTDGRLYERIARGLLESGKFVAEPIYPPGYPFFIAAVYKLFGSSLLALRIVEALIGTATVGLIGWFGSRWFGPLPGAIAALLAAFHPIMVFLPMTQYAETLLMFLTALGFGVIGCALRRPRGLLWLASGVVFGLSMLVKPVSTSFLPGLALGSWIQLGRVRYPRWRAALLFVVGLALPLTPWVLRSHAVHDRWFLVSTGGGRLFWVVNNRATDGVNTMLDTPDLVDTLIARPSYIDRDQYYYRVGQEFVREQPVRALTGYARRITKLWALYPTPITKNQYSIDLADWVMGTMSLLLYAGAAIGLTRLGGTGLAALPLAMASFTLMNCWYFMVMRYRMTFESILLWLAGLGYAWLLSERKRPASSA